MKKLFAFLITFFIFQHTEIYAQKKNKKKPGKKAATANRVTYKYNVQHTADYISQNGEAQSALISRSVSERMAVNFQYGLRREPGTTKEISSLKTDYWINSNTMLLVADFLKRHTDYDGVRIWFGCSDTLEPQKYPDQKFQRTTYIFLYPTKKDVSSSDCSEHETVYVDMLQLNRCDSETVYIRDYEQCAKNLINRFESEYPLEIGHELSRAVWLDRTLFLTFDILIRDNPAYIDGVNFKVGAYSDWVEHKTFSCNLYPKPSTLMLIPTSPSGEYHLDNYFIFEEVEKKVKGRYVDTNRYKSLNHGELCPNSCN